MNASAHSIRITGQAAARWLCAASLAWFAHAAAAQDCNTNGIPDACDLSCGGAGCNVPGCGQGFDCNRNGVLDQCEASFVTYLWQGIDGASFTLASNWSPPLVPGGNALLRNVTANNNLSVLNAAGKTTVCGLTVERTGAGLQRLQIAAGATLENSTGASIRSGGQVELTGGELAGAPIDNAGRIAGNGSITASLINRGRVEGSAAGGLGISGALFDNQSGATLAAPAQGLIFVQTDSVTQAGIIEIQTDGGVVYSQTLTNLSGGNLQMLGGSIGAEEIINNMGGTIVGQGTIATHTVNRGDITGSGNLLVVGNLTNHGMLRIEGGTFTVTENLTGGGCVSVESPARSGDPRGIDQRLTVIQDVTLLPGACVNMGEGEFRVGGHVDNQIADSARFDMTQAQMRFVGLPTDGPQDFEAVAPDRGRFVTYPDSSLFVYGSFRLGPTATTVHLVDRRDNSPGVGREAVYADQVTFDSGTKLDLAGHHFYYRTLLRAGMILDTVGGGSFCQISPVLPGNGDMNGDCRVNILDIPLFLGVLLGQDADPIRRSLADMLADGVANGRDVGPFTTRLITP